MRVKNSLINEISEMFGSGIMLKQNNYTCLSFRFETVCGAVLPPYLGSALRGALGGQLLLKHCKNRDRNCMTCEYAPTCTFVKFFNRLALSSKKRYALPNPYVVYHQQPARKQYPAGGELLFEVKLFGGSSIYADEVIEALERGCANGLGTNRSPFSLTDVKKTHGKIMPEMCFGDETTVKLRFDTPLRIKTFAKGIIWALDFPLLITNILRRIDGLNVAEMETSSRDVFSNIAGEIQTKYHSLRKLHLERYSNHTGGRKSMSGLVGDITFTGERLSTFINLLHAGECLHVGRGCSMGLGHYRIIEWQ